MNSHNSPDVKPRKQKFIEEVCLLLLPNNSKGTAFLRFLQHYTRKWHLQSIDPYDVLIEGILRGLQAIESGRSIEKPEAWLRQTTLNILKDKVKHSIKDEQLEKALVGSQPIQSRYSDNPLAEAELLEQLEILEKAFQKLPILDRDIIYQRFYLGKTYKQIQSTSESLNGQIIQEATLRKREARALKKLKRIFLKLYQMSADPVP